MSRVKAERIVDRLAHILNRGVKVQVVVEELAAYEAAVEALERTVNWIETECQPEAEWVAKGHNWSMSEDDRARAVVLLTDARAALAPLRDEVPA